MDGWVDRWMNEWSKRKKRRSRNKTHEQKKKTGGPGENPQGEKKSIKKNSDATPEGVGASTSETRRYVTVRTMPAFFIFSAYPRSASLVSGN